eukprot:942896-Rhodomonas_salina.1
MRRESAHLEDSDHDRQGQLLDEQAEQGRPGKRWRRSGERQGGSRKGTQGFKLKTLARDSVRHYLFNCYGLEPPLAAKQVTRTRSLSLTVMADFQVERSRAESRRVRVSVRVTGSVPKCKSDLDCELRIQLEVDVRVTHHWHAALARAQSLSLGLQVDGVCDAVALLQGLADVV